MAETPRIYTKGGDRGTTSTVDGTRVSKHNERIDAYGTVDELNSFIGLLVARLNASTQTELFQTRIEFLTRIQNQLFNLGSQLATIKPHVREKMPKVPDSEVEAMETAIDAMTAELTPLREFILPGGSETAALSHVCRTITRRAERLCVALHEKGETDDLNVRYLNRLSDYFFVLARSINHSLRLDEPVWKKS